jgi:uncharacterized protein
MSHVRKHLISIYVTAYCNMACEYCVLSAPHFNIDEEDKKIDLDFAKQGIYDFFRDYSGGGIRFYGAGEPTLGFEIMKELTDYARSLKNNCYTELQTNGLFSSEVGEWVSSNIDMVWISYDGSPDIQNKYRKTKNNKDSADVVERNITFLSNAKKVEVGCRITLPLESIDRQKEFIDNIYNMNIKYISVERAFSAIQKNGFQINKQNPEYFVEKYLEAFDYAKEKGIFYSNLNMANFDEKTRYSCRACVPYPHLTTDGYVSSCDMAPFGRDKYSQFTQKELIYGKWDKKTKKIIYDENIIHKIRSRNTENLAKLSCQNCEIIDNCAGGCMGQAFNESNNILGKCQWNCQVTKLLARKMSLNEELYPMLHS